MGFASKDPALANPVTVVTSDIGRGQFNGRQLPKMRLWVLADRTATIITPHPDDPRQVIRQSYRVDTGVSMHRDKKIVVNLFPTEEANFTEPLVLDSKGCGCGFGIVAAAPPTDEPHYLANVHPMPDWWDPQP